MKTIIDTNFLLIPFTHKIDVFTQIRQVLDVPVEICIIDKTIGELKKIKDEQKGKDSRAAGFALQLISKYKPGIIQTDSEHDVDTEIVNIAKNEQVIVATQDKGLKERLKSTKAQILVMRSKNYLKLIHS